MVKMNLKDLQRDPDSIKKHLKKIGKTYVAKNDISILFPDRYINKNLATLGSTVKVVGIFIILDEDGKYGVLNIPTLVELTPDMVLDVSIGTEIYKMLKFTKDSIVMPNSEPVKMDSFIDPLFDLFMVFGKVPFFLEPHDLSDIFVESDRFAGTGIGNNTVTMELITSIITVKENGKVSYVGLRDVFDTFKDTTSRMVGSYMGSGITASLVDPYEGELTEMEKILRA
jgi:hypothetical protein